MNAAEGAAFGLLNSWVRSDPMMISHEVFILLYKTVPAGLIWAGGLA
jgi:hypothetical protein